MSRKRRPTQPARRKADGLRGPEHKLSRPFVGAVALVVLLLAAAVALRLAPTGKGGAGSSGLETLLPTSLDGLDPADRKRIEALELQIRQSADAEPAFLGQAYGELGMHYLAFERMASARPALTNAARLMGRDARWPYYLGVLAAEAGDHEAAVGHFEEARARDPEDAPTLLRLAESLIELGRWAEARPMIVSALERAPGEARGHALLGQIAQAQGDARTAATHLESALELQPAASSLYFPLSQAYRAMGEVEKADAALAQRGPGPASLVDDPRMRDLFWIERSAMARISAGATLMEQGRSEEAAATYRAAAETEPDNAMAHGGLGAALLSLGQLEAAGQALERSRELDPENVNTLNNLARIAIETGQPERAEARLREVLAVDPTNASAHRMLGRTLRAQGRCEEAAGFLVTALAAEPADTRARMELLLCLLATGQHAAALEAAESGLQVAPDDLGLSLTRVRLLAASPVAELRDGARAVALAETLLADQRSAEAVEAAAMAHAEVGDFDRALALQREVLNIVQSVDRPEWLRYVEANLQRYQQSLPCRQPLPDFMLGS